MRFIDLEIEKSVFDVEVISESFAVVFLSVAQFCTFFQAVGFYTVFFGRVKSLVAHFQFDVFIIQKPFVVDRFPDGDNVAFVSFFAGAFKFFQGKTFCIDIDFPVEFSRILFFLIGDFFEFDDVGFSAVQLQSIRHIEIEKFPVFLSQLSWRSIEI